MIFDILRNEVLFGGIAAGTSVVGAAASDLTGVGSIRDYIELGALAIVLIILMSYFFRVFLPRWQDSNDKRFEELSKLFSAELKSMRDDADQQRQINRDTVNQLRNDHRATLDAIADRFNLTLDKIATENRELWKQERDRFSESYTRLEKAMEKLCDTVCDALSEIKDRTRPNV